MLFAVYMFVVGLARLISPDYGQAFAEAMASLYPGYSGAATFGQMIIGALYGALDGAIGGAVFGWLYNWCSERRSSSSSASG
jgi:membrane associated rhomboid family serine protease